MTADAPHYPALDTDTVFNVGVILRHMEENSEYLNDVRCPYAQDVRDWLFRFKAKVKATFEIADLEEEAEQLFSQLKQLGDDVKSAETKEKVAYMRVATSLFDKLVQLKERAAGVKSVAEFQKTVLEIIDNLMTPEQRTILMDRLQQAQIR